MFDTQHAKRPENDRSSAEPTQEPSRTKQNPGDLTRIPLYTQLAWGNQPPPWLRLSVQRKDPHEEEVLQEENKATQHKENMTGLPDTLKAGIETLSGLSMDDVQVHYHSFKPAEVQALAYTQGTEIHVGPGQEQHLAHEAWHVVQQKQGRVQPTMQMKQTLINDEQDLEREADEKGSRATKMLSQATSSVARVEGIRPLAVGNPSLRVTQLLTSICQDCKTVFDDEETTVCPTCERHNFDYAEEDKKYCPNKQCHLYLVPQDTTKPHCEHCSGGKGENKTKLLEGTQVTKLIEKEEKQLTSGDRGLKAVIQNAERWVGGSGSHHRSKGGRHGAAATEKHSAASGSKNQVRSGYITNLEEAIAAATDKKLIKEGEDMIKRVGNK